VRGVLGAVPVTAGAGFPEGVDGVALDVGVLVDDVVGQGAERLARLGAGIEVVGAAVGEVQVCLGTSAECLMDAWQGDLQ
jgi:hypothetical protein